MYPVIFDANVWVKYARARNIAPILDRMIAYRFLPIVNNYLIGEVFDALVDNKWMNKHQANAIIDFIKKIAVFQTERAVYRLSLDPKDNYLFDFAIQNNCAFIISDDSKLLLLKLKPLPVHTTSWFLKKFPLH